MQKLDLPVFFILQVNRHYVTIDDYVDLPPENETMLQQAVAAQPVTAFICATGREFQLYDWVSFIFQI